MRHSQASCGQLDGQDNAVPTYVRFFIHAPLHVITLICCSWISTTKLGPLVIVAPGTLRSLMLLYNYAAGIALHSLLVHDAGHFRCSRPDVRPQSRCFLRAHRGAPKRACLLRRISSSTDRPLLYLEIQRCLQPCTMLQAPIRSCNSGAIAQQYNTITIST